VKRPRHPYTEGLLGSTVHEVPKGTRLTPITGSPPNLALLPPGCSFAPRCRYAETRCTSTFPAAVTLGSHLGYDHVTRCINSHRVGPAQRSTA
jgi:peptide/nickel transport system ATP-binding protein